MARAGNIANKNLQTARGTAKTAIKFAVVAALCGQYMACASTHATDRRETLGAIEYPKQVGYLPISAPLQNTVAALRAAGITQENARQRNASTYSTEFVKVNDSAAIQVHVKVRTANKKALTSLERLGMLIELRSDALGLVQGWAPFDRIEDIAALDFVERVSPPDYAMPR